MAEVGSEVGSYEAKTHLPKLLDRVAQGEEITITRRGKPVAKLVPIEAERKRKIREAIEGLRKFRASKPMTTKEIIEMIEEGRRY